MPGVSPDPHAEAKRFFDRIAEDYRIRSETGVHSVSSLSFRRRQDIVTKLLLETPSGGTVLDYGMGPAVFGPAATANHLHYIGIDISERMIELARAMNLPNTEYHLGDLSLLGQFTGQADTVLLIGLIDYLQDPADGLRQLARCVKPGGRLIMSFRNRRSLPRLLRDCAKRIWRRRPGRGQEQTAFEAPVLENSFVPSRDLESVLREAGFATCRVSYLDCSPIFFNMPLPRRLWEAGRVLDAVFACPALSFLCASGVLVAGGKA